MNIISKNRITVKIRGFGVEALGFYPLPVTSLQLNFSKFVSAMLIGNTFVLKGIVPKYTPIDKVYDSKTKFIIITIADTNKCQMSLTTHSRKI